MEVLEKETARIEMAVLEQEVAEALVGKVPHHEAEPKRMNADLRMMFSHLDPEGSAF